MAEPHLFWFGCLLFLVSVSLILSLVGSHAQTPSAQEAAADDSLRQECLRLQQALQQQAVQVTDEVRQTTFEQLQTLLTNYPTVSKMAQAKPDLPAKNLISLFTPLENLLHSWGYEAIAAPWQQVPYDPQLHQPDVPDMEVGEMVYVRFIGYRQGETILCPAKVSRTLPGS